MSKWINFTGCRRTDNRSPRNKLPCILWVVCNHAKLHVRINLQHSICCHSVILRRAPGRGDKILTAPKLNYTKIITTIFCDCNTRFQPLNNVITTIINISQSLKCSINLSIIRNRIIKKFIINHCVFARQSMKT